MGNVVSKYVSLCSAFFTRNERPRQLENGRPSQRHHGRLAVSLDAAVSFFHWTPTAADTSGGDGAPSPTSMSHAAASRLHQTGGFGASNHTLHSSHQGRSTIHSFPGMTSHGGALGSPVVSFHASLVRESTREQDFYDMYQVLNEIATTKMSKIFRIRKYEHKIGGSSRPEGTATVLVPTLQSEPLPPHHRQQQRSNNPMSSDIHQLNNSMNNTTKTPAPENLSILRKQYERAFSDKRLTLEPEHNETIIATTDTSEDATDDVARGKIKRENANGDTGLYFALKLINLDMVNESQIEQLKSEIEILRVLDHKNIINAYESFQIRSYNKFMFVMELCTGGDLYTRMPYTERQVAYAMRQVVSAIDYLHSQNIIHRDIKMENIIWESNHPEAAIKVIDFGLSKSFTRHNHVFTQRVGSLYSMSPETMKGVYTTQADLWSIGVCAYIALCQEKPFDGDSPKDVVAAVLKGDFAFKTTAPMEGADMTDKPTNVWDDISDHAKSFISQLLMLDPDDRLNASTAIHHQWFYQELPLLLGSGWEGSSVPSETLEANSTTTLAETTALTPNAGLSNATPTPSELDRGVFSSLSTSKEFKTSVFANIMKFANMGVFRRLALNVVAKRSTSSQVFFLRKVFDEFNTLNTGTISLGEFKAAAAMARSPYPADKIKNAFRRVNVNCNKVINYTEFLAASLEALGPIEEYRLAEAFDLMDCDDSGYISRDNIRQLVGDLARDERYINQIYLSANSAHGDKITYNDFLDLFRSEDYTMSHAITSHGKSKEPDILARPVPLLGGAVDALRKRIIDLRRELDMAKKLLQREVESAKRDFASSVSHFDISNQTTAILGVATGTQTGASIRLLDVEFMDDIGVDEDLEYPVETIIPREEVVELREEYGTAKQELRSEFREARNELVISQSEFEVEDDIKFGLLLGQPGRELIELREELDSAKYELSAMINFFPEEESQNLLDLVEEEIQVGDDFLDSEDEVAVEELREELELAKEELTAARADFDPIEEASALLGLKTKPDEPEEPAQAEVVQTEPNRHIDRENQQVVMMVSNAVPEVPEDEEESAMSTYESNQEEGEGVAELQAEIRMAKKEMTLAEEDASNMWKNFEEETAARAVHVFDQRRVEDDGLAEFQEELKAAKSELLTAMSPYHVDKKLKRGNSFHPGDDEGVVQFREELAAAKSELEAARVDIKVKDTEPFLRGVARNLETATEQNNGVPRAEMQKVAVHRHSDESIMSSEDLKAFELEMAAAKTEMNIEEVAEQLLNGFSKSPNTTEFFDASQGELALIPGVNPTLTSWELDATTETRITIEDRMRMPEQIIIAAQKDNVVNHFSPDSAANSEFFDACDELPVTVLTTELLDSDVLPRTETDPYSTNVSESRTAGTLDPEERQEIETTDKHTPATKKHGLIFGLPDLSDSNCEYGEPLGNLTEGGSAPEEEIALCSMTRETSEKKSPLVAAASGEPEVSGPSGEEMAYRTNDEMKIRESPLTKSCFKKEGIVEPSTTEKQRMISSSRESEKEEWHIAEADIDSKKVGRKHHTTETDVAWAQMGTTESSSESDLMAKNMQPFQTKEQNQPVDMCAVEDYYEKGAPVDGMKQDTNESLPESQEVGEQSSMEQELDGTQSEFPGTSSMNVTPDDDESLDQGPKAPAMVTASLSIDAVNDRAGDGAIMPSSSEPMKFDSTTASIRLTGERSSDGMGLRPASDGKSQHPEVSESCEEVAEAPETRGASMPIESVMGLPVDGMPPKQDVSESCGQVTEATVTVGLSATVNSHRYGDDTAMTLPPCDESDQPNVSEPCQTEEKESPTKELEANVVNTHTSSQNEMERIQKEIAVTDFKSSVERREEETGRVDRQNEMEGNTLIVPPLVESTDPPQQAVDRQNEMEENTAPPLADIFETLENKVPIEADAGGGKVGIESDRNEKQEPMESKSLVLKPVILDPDKMQRDRIVNGVTTTPTLGDVLSESKDAALSTAIVREVNFDQKT